MEKLKAGLLPISMKLLNDSRPEIKVKLENFADTISAELSGAGLKVIKAPISCISEEFEKSIRIFEQKSVNAIITLHLTYSPSLESAVLLSETKIPLIILNTTPSISLGPKEVPDDITYNHGIHGVQDFCNILGRQNKKFFIESGHWEKSDVIKRVLKRVVQASMANRFLNSRVGIIDKPFAGMGDFQVPFEILKETFGMQVISSDVNEILGYFESVKDKEIDSEFECDRSRFNISSNIDTGLYKDSLKTGIAVRNWIKDNNLDAFTMNALSFNFKSKLPLIPFLEASKQMAEKGLGYSGEGDILTAVLLSSVIKAFPESAFTETFCPDWKSNSIFLNHIGEGNYKLIKDKPVALSKKYAISDSRDIVVLAGTYKSGKASLINIAPAYQNRFKLIITNGEIIETKTVDNMNNTIHGWFKPEIDISDFLSGYSLAGGTHHSVLVYNDSSYDLEQFGKLMNWEVIKIC